MELFQNPPTCRSRGAAGWSGPASCRGRRGGRSGGDPPHSATASPGQPDVVWGHSL